MIKISEIKCFDFENHIVNFDYKFSQNPIEQHDYYRLKNSIKKNGVIEPILVQRSGDNLVLIDGFQRVKVLKELGVETVDYTESGFKNFYEKEINRRYYCLEHRVLFFLMTITNKKYLQLSEFIFEEYKKDKLRKVRDNLQMVFCEDKFFYPINRVLKIIFFYADTYSNKNFLDFIKKINKSIDLKKFFLNEYKEAKEFYLVGKDKKEINKEESLDLEIKYLPSEDISVGFKKFEQRSKDINSLFDLLYENFGDNFLEIL